MRKLALLLAIPLALAACAQGATTTSGRSAGGTANLSAPAPEAVADSKAGTGQSGQGVPTGVVVNPDRSLILTAKVDMRSKDPWATSDRAQAIAVALGGDVLSLQQSGTGDQRSAFLSMRVPSNRFNDALQQLRALDGEIQSSNVSTQDVTDQFVDLQARLAAKQAEEQRYNALLARANTIDEILKIDASLSSVRTQIEQLTGQINSIKSRTDYSTIALSVSPLGLLPGDDTAKTWDPARTVGRAIAALAAMLQVFADLTIWLIVFGWIPLLALAGVFLAARARRAPAATA